MKKIWMGVDTGGTFTELALCGHTLHGRSRSSMFARAAMGAGLRLPERPFALFCSKAPAMLDMLERIRRSQSSALEPAGVFMLRADR